METTNYNVEKRAIFGRILFGNNISNYYGRIADLKP